MQGKFYKTVVKPAIAFGLECQALNRKQMIKMKDLEIAMLVWDVLRECLI